MNLNPFAKPTPLFLATQELEEARRDSLAANTALDYARSLVTYQQARITRLSATVRELAAETESERE
jgi:hypothetical protein